MNVALTALFAATVAAATGSALGQESPPEAVETVPAGIPLRVELNRTYHMRVGATIEGRLIEPVYLVDHVVIPKDSKVFGSVTGRRGINRHDRTAALLNGDLTPLKKAEVTFDDLETPDGRHFPIDTESRERTTETVHMSTGDAKPHRSLGQRIASAFRWTKRETIAGFRAPHKADAVRQFLYQQVPFHPQQIWAGTQYDAELKQPLELEGQTPAAPVPVADLTEANLTGTIEARLLDEVDSSSARPGTPVEAVLTRPLFQDEPSGGVPASSKHNQGKLLLPEGTRLIGTVVRAKPAGMFGHNGSLRLTFRKVELPAGDERSVHGHLTQAEASKNAHLHIDSEGAAKATSSNRFLTSVSLGSLAAVGDDTGTSLVREVLAGNGLDLVTRVVGTAVAGAGLVSGFGYYEAGKVVFDEWIGRGHDVVFERNTRVEIALTQRQTGSTLASKQEADAQVGPLNVSPTSPTVENGSGLEIAESDLR